MIMFQQRYSRRWSTVVLDWLRSKPSPGTETTTSRSITATSFHWSGPYHTAMRTPATLNLSVSALSTYESLSLSVCLSVCLSQDIEVYHSNFFPLECCVSWTQLWVVAAAATTHNWVQLTQLSSASTVVNVVTFTASIPFIAGSSESNYINNCWSWAASVELNSTQLNWTDDSQWYTVYDTYCDTLNNIIIVDYNDGDDLFVHSKQ